MLHAGQPNVAPTLRIPALRYTSGVVCQPLSWEPWHAKSDPGCRVLSRARHPPIPHTRVTLWVCRRSAPRSLARMGRRFAALTVDWFIAYGLVALALAAGWVTVQTQSTWVLAAWFVLGSSQFGSSASRPVSTRWG